MLHRSMFSVLLLVYLLRVFATSVVFNNETAPACRISMSALLLALSPQCVVAAFRCFARRDGEGADCRACGGGGTSQRGLSAEPFLDVSQQPQEPVFHVITV